MGTVTPGRRVRIRRSTIYGVDALINRDRCARRCSGYSGNTAGSRVGSQSAFYLNLASHCWSDESGNQSSSLILAEIDGDDHIVYEARFDEDGFNGAFEELETPLLLRKGAAFAEYGNTASQLMTAENSGDYDKLFNELAAPGLLGREPRAGHDFS